MHRRDFLSISGATLLGGLSIGRPIFAAEPRVATSSGIKWRRHEPTGLFEYVAVGGQSLVDPTEGVGVFDGFCRIVDDEKLSREILLDSTRSQGTCGPVQLSLTHRLLASKADANDDLLEATLRLQNTSERPCEVLAGFLTGVRPCRAAADQQMYLPITARGLSREPEKHDCHQRVGTDGYLAHYFEREASDPRQTASQATLLVPVVDVFAPSGPCRVALFSPSVEPAFFQALEGPSTRAWRMGRRVRLEPGASMDLKAYLLLHGGDASEAWTAFHRFAHHEDFVPPEWTRQFRVNYYDFLSAAEADGPRGGGYDLDLAHFREFHIGMATQHGYYLTYGDFIHPDRRQWQAMPSDPKGPVAMSLEKMKARVEATRRAGARPIIYMHYTILDQGSPLFEKLKDAIQVDAAGNPIVHGWTGPDTIKKSWQMSTAAPAWRDHLVQQAQWIMELLNPDGIVLDETFCAFGHDHHPDRRGPVMPGGIELMRRLRATVRSFGEDKALFASDCSMGSYCLWADGEAGDHCYDRLLGHPFYRREPVRYLAALGTKAWQPCAWLYKTLWSAQMDLARKTGAGVGVTNGWGDNFGLARLPEDVKQQMLRDIASLVRGKANGPA